MKKFILSLLTIPLFLSAAPAYALSCIQPSFEREVAGAQAIFKGRVLKIETFSKEKNINLITATAEEPLAGVTDNQVIKIYWRNWMAPAPNWVENEAQKKEGLFALRQIKPEDAGIETSNEESIYFLGMCSQIYFADTPENRAFIPAD